MKTLILSICLLAGIPAFAATTMSVNNSALGFTLTSIPMGDISLTICNSTNQCYSFKQVKNIDAATVEYKEVSGKCSLTVQTFDKSFGTGSTKNDFMLELMAFVVKVTAGEDNCTLLQTSMGQNRSLTGIYL